MSETATPPVEIPAVNELPPDIARKNKRGAYSPAKTVFTDPAERAEMMDAGGDHFAKLKTYNVERGGKTYYVIANTPLVALGMVAEFCEDTVVNPSGRRGGFHAIKTADDLVGSLVKLSDEEREKALAHFAAMLSPSKKKKK